MTRIKKEVEYTPEITIDQIMAFRSDKPETHTPIDFINKICAFLEKHPRVLAGGQLHEYLGLESKHLAYTPALHCHGKEPYILHGELGSSWLSRKQQGWAMYCASRHLGAGITDDELIRINSRILFDTTPKRPLDKLICYASCFYSVFNPDHKRTVEEIRGELVKYGDAAVKRFDELHRMFG